MNPDNKTPLMDDEAKKAKGGLNSHRPAFPSDFNYGDEDFTGMPIIVHRTSFGLTKREYFAAMAMQGLLAKVDDYGDSEKEDNISQLASDAIELADELLNQLDHDR